MQETVRIDRQHYIGGSDIPAIMNISSFKTRYQLLREKAGLEVSDFEGNAYTEYGQEMEEKIRDYVNMVTGGMFTEGKHFEKIFIDGVEQDDIGIRCHTDGENDVAILEIKTTSQVYNDISEYNTYLVQLLFYMCVAKRERGVLAVYKRPEDFSTEFDADRLQIFEIEESSFTLLKERILKEVEKFVIDRHKLIENPFLTEEDFLPKDISVIADGLLVLEKRIAEFKAVEKEYEKQKESLLKAMQNAGVPSWRTTNGYLITAVEETPSTTTTEEVLDEESLKKNLPELFKSEAEGGYMKTVTKTKNGRKAYLKITAPKGAK